MNPPKNQNRFPMKWAKAPTVPFLAVRPIIYSSMISGILQKKRNTSQATRKLPAPSVPPLDAAIRGYLQIFPVPTAIPRALTKNANLEEKRGDDSGNIYLGYVHSPASLKQ